MFCPLWRLPTYGITEKIVKAIEIMYENTSAVVFTLEGGTIHFDINIGVHQGNSLALYTFTIVLDYVLKTAIVED